MLVCFYQNSSCFSRVFLHDKYHYFCNDISDTNSCIFCTNSESHRLIFSHDKIQKSPNFFYSENMFSCTSFLLHLEVGDGPVRAHLLLAAQGRQVLTHQSDVQFPAARLYLADFVDDIFPAPAHINGQFVAVTPEMRKLDALFHELGRCRARGKELVVRPGISVTRFAGFNQVRRVLSQLVAVEAVVVTHAWLPPGKRKSPDRISRTRL